MIHFPTADEEYTAFIPMDDSFAQWYPIDWGFNPFDVESFVKETMMNHFVRGRVKQKEIKDGASWTTLGGKTLTFSFSPVGNLMPTISHFGARSFNISKLDR